MLGGHCLASGSLLHHPPHPPQSSLHKNMSLMCEHRSSVVLCVYVCACAFALGAGLTILCVHRVFDVHRSFNGAIKTVFIYVGAAAEPDKSGGKWTRKCLITLCSNLHMNKVWPTLGSCYFRFCRYSDRSPSAGTASISKEKQFNVDVHAYTWHFIETDFL